jgi:hypothetical protein
MLLAIVIAVASLACVSASSATSWDGVGKTYKLDASDLIFTAPALSSSWTCTATQLHVDVTSQEKVTVTKADFQRDCHGISGAVLGCTVTAQATDLHWMLTAPLLKDVTIHGVSIDFPFETRPPAGSTPCPSVGTNIKVTGTLGPGEWDPASHQVTFVNAPGLTGHLGAGSFPVLVDGTFRDAAQTMTLT